MSEYSQSEFGHLHVLRHNFRPSLPLQAELRTVLKSGVNPDFLFHSTKEAYVDSFLYHHDRYHREELKALEIIKKRQRYTFDIAQVAMRELTPQPARLPVPKDAVLPESRLRISVLPSDMAGFHSLVSSLNTFPDMYPRKEPIRHYMYVDIPMSQVKSEDEFEEDETLEGTIVALQRKVGETASRHLFTMTLEERLSGREIVRPYSALRPGWRGGVPVETQ